VSVEAASTFGWTEWVTEDGDSIGLDRFGASAPQEDLYEAFGFTSEHVAARARAVIERLGART
jgi:transketolase